MQFINRLGEMQRLNHLASLRESQVVVLWGRRRIGKTRLLLEWTNQHKGIYFTADESAATVQRKYFANALEQALPGFSSVEYPDWTSFFSRLARDATNQKWRGPLVIDELPYLVATSPELPSVLQRFIDREAPASNLILALCGSSQRMMQGAVLSASAPLYGRASEIIKLNPINIGYIGEALTCHTPREMLQAFSVWGGVPRYWELANNSGESFIKTIDRLVLESTGALNDEPNRLLLEETPSALSLRPILDAIGQGAERLSEIATKIGQPATSISRQIHKLIDLDMIEREFPFECSELNSKKTLYKIKDPFMRFWFKLIASRRSIFAQMPTENRQEWLKNNLSSIYSQTWEEVCRNGIALLSEAWKTPFYYAGRYWHGQGPEWDIVAKSMDSTHYLIGEAKWTEGPPSEHFIYQHVEKLIKKGLPPIARPKNVQIAYALFVPEKPKKLELPDHVKIIDAQEMMDAYRK